jgi:probable HAF family extracellular repeat protein
MGWIGSGSAGASPTTTGAGRRRGTTTVARRVALALAASIGLVAGVTTGATPAGAWDDDTPDDMVAWTGALPGFVLRDGRYTAFEARQTDVAMYPSGINDRGQITGEYVRRDGESGFVRSPDGRLTTFDVPGASATEAAKINDDGQIVGRYSEDTPLVDDSERVHGFVRDRRGIVTTVDYPGAQHTLPTGINDGGDVVGHYVNARGATHGFLWKDGRFTQVDLVGAREATPMDVNDRGEIVGIYLDARGAAHGFLLSGTQYRTITVPGAVGTLPSGINDRGEVVGYSADDLLLGGASGFRRGPGGVADPASPAGFTAVNVPGAPRTLPLGINDRGDVVGLNEVPDPAATWPQSAEEMPAMSAAGSDRLALVEVRGITVNAAIAGPVEDLLAAAEADGLDFSGGGYRSAERQIELRRQHCGTSYYAIYEAPSSSCSPPTARPGRSLHERGLAIDFNCDGDLVRSRESRCFAWLDANANRFGLYNLPSEPWHWSLTGQ